MSLIHGPKIPGITDGLVLYLDANLPSSYSGTGTAWYDLSKYSNNGTISNANYTLNGKQTNFNFDNSEDYVLVNNSSTFNFASNFTVSSWIKVNSFNTSLIHNVISKKTSYNSAQKGWSCQYDYRTSGVLQFRNNDGTSLSDHTPTSSSNNTTLLNQTNNYVNSVWVISNNTVSFYINGNFLQTIAVIFTNTDTTNNIYIGKTATSTPGGDPSLIMSLGVISLYNRALSATEIQQNFNATRSRYGI
nr:MAG: hypothetical protein [Caudoviricetes sp.]